MRSANAPSLPRDASDPPLPVFPIASQVSLRRNPLCFLINERRVQIGYGFGAAMMMESGSVPAAASYALLQEREEKRRGTIPLRHSLLYRFPGIPTENAGAMFFMSPGSPEVWRTIMIIPHFPIGDSGREDSYDPLPCPSDRNM